MALAAREPEDERTVSTVWDDDRWDPDRMMNGDGSMYGGAWLMVLLTLLVVGALVATVVVVLRAMQSDPSRGLPGGTAGPAGTGERPDVGSPRDLLDQRLARGEITPEEYRATRALLGE